LAEPLVIVLHDWYGRLPWLDTYADGLARVGFRVAIPDFFDGATTDDADVARSLMDGLDVGHALATVDDLVLDGRTDGSTRIATVGFSMGGWLALLHAQGGSVDAVVSYYATLTSAEHGIVPCPVLLNLAETDTWQEGGYPESFIDRLKDHGTPVTAHSYLGAAHSFANASIEGTFHASASALAFARTAAFLEDQLSD
jgi:carboxymethylenebutenolidase